MNRIWVITRIIVALLPIIIRSEIDYQNVTFMPSYEHTSTVTEQQLKYFDSMGLSFQTGPNGSPIFQQEDQRGFIRRDRMLSLDLTDILALEKTCGNGNWSNTQSSPLFRQCAQNTDYSGVRVMFSPDRSDIESWVMPGSIDFLSGKQSDEPPQVYPPFAPHLIAVKESFMTHGGLLCNHKIFYIHGGCSDKGEYISPIERVHIRRMKIRVFNEPVLSFLIPYPNMYYHEVMEMHSMFLMSAPLIRAYPKIPIVINYRLMFYHMFPLLDALIYPLTVADLNLQSIRLESRKGQRWSQFYAIHAPYIITPLSPWCNAMPRSVMRDMRAAYATALPKWWGPDTGNGIVIHDRVGMTKRPLAQGELIFQELRRRYGQTRSVTRIFGNETAEQFVKIFRGCRVFLSSHGAALTNLLFMPKDSIGNLNIFKCTDTTLKWACIFTF